MNDWYHGLTSQGIDTLKEGQASGALSTRIAQLFTLAQDEGALTQAPIAVDPGDAMFVGGDTSLSLSLPIAYDVWYLWYTVNIMPQDADEAEQFISTILEPIFKNHSMVSPLRTISRDVAVGGEEITPDVFFFQNKGFYCIKEMRFETFLHDKSPLYVSDGPDYATNSEIDHTGRGIADMYCGYLAFPVGPLGVEQVVSVVSRSLLDDEAYQVKDNSLDPVASESLLTPIGNQTDDCMGRHLIEKAYLKIDRDVEYPAKTMAGQESVLPHHWMRLWLDKEGKWPVPGEFIGMVVKPLGAPPHCWWYQETSPLLYSGQFFETEYYTSGIILAVIEEVDRDFDSGTATYEVVGLSLNHEQRSGYGEYQLTNGDQFEDWQEVGNIYKVRVKDQDLYLRPSDFLEYSIDQAVAIRKVPGKKENFTWGNLEPGRIVTSTGVLEQQQYDNLMAGKDFEISDEWAIVPITFYEE